MIAETKTFACEAQLRLQLDQIYFVDAKRFTYRSDTKLQDQKMLNTPLKIGDYRRDSPIPAVQLFLAELIKAANQTL